MKPRTRWLLGLFFDLCTYSQSREPFRKHTIGLVRDLLSCFYSIQKSSEVILVHQRLQTFMVENVTQDDKFEINIPLWKICTSEFQRFKSCIRRRIGVPWTSIKKNFNPGGSALPPKMNTASVPPMWSLVRVTKAMFIIKRAVIKKKPDYLLNDIETSLIGAEQYLADGTLLTTIRIYSTKATF